MSDNIFVDEIHSRITAPQKKCHTHAYHNFDICVALSRLAGRFKDAFLKLVQMWRFQKLKLCHVKVLILSGSSHLIMDFTTIRTKLLYLSMYSFSNQLENMSLNNWILHTLSCNRLFTAAGNSFAKVFSMRG